MAWAAAVPVALWALVRTFGLESGYPLVPLISYTPYVAAVSLIVLAACLLLRRWAAAAVASLAALLLVLAVSPRIVSGGAKEEGAPLRVMSANVLKGQGLPNQLLELARERDVDVLTAQELTPEIARDLERLGVREQFPHAVLSPEEGASGGGIYSRYPASRLPNSYLEFTQARARIGPPGREPLDVVSVHPVAPTSPRAIDQWQAGLDSLPRPEDIGVQLLLGDFNATLDHSEFREILDRGYKDAGEQAGGGLIPTWPAVAEPFRYLPVTIDHLLCEADRCDVGAYEVLDLERSDHRPVFATFYIH